MANRNKFSKALKHLKNKSIDEKLELLEAIPTNNTTGIFVDVPGTFDTEETPAEIDSALDLDQDDSATDTTGLFESDGTIRAVEPPGDTSYVLGPMMSMWYAWGNFTQIGYVRQSDRKMVNLARITGELDNWDGSSNFTSYGQLTLDQAVWFQGQSRADYRAFYPGPPSNPADQHGRYIGSIVNTSKSSTPGSRQVFVPGTNTGFNPSAVFSSILNQSGQVNTIITNEINNIMNLTGDANAAEASAQITIGGLIANSNWPSIRNPVRSPPPVIPYNDPGVQNLPGNMRPYRGPQPSGNTYQMASYVLKGNLLWEQASGGGTITAHTDAGDVTVNIPSEQQIQQLMPPQPKQGMRTTPEGGAPTDYSKQQLSNLKAYGRKFGEHGEFFVAGFISNTEPAQLEKMFAGTTVSWYQVARMNSQIKEVEKAADQAYDRWFEIFDETQPQITSLLAQMSSINLTGYDVYYGKYLPLANEVDRLFALRDAQLEYAMGLSSRRLEMSGRLGTYVLSGRLVDIDPFKINDPTIKKTKELDEQEINDLINELKQAASDARRSALLKKLKAFGYGALLLAGAALGFKLLGGVAAIKALGAPVVNMLKRLAPKVKVTKPPVTKPFQNASDDFIRAITDPKNYTRANDAVSRAPKAFKNDVGIQINIGGKTQTVNAADILRFKGFQIQSYRPSGKLLTENQKRILRDIKKPVKVKEMPKSFKVKPTGRNNKVVGAGLMKPIEDPKAFKPDPAIWKAGHKKYNEVSSQDKKNHVLELVGASDHHWSTLIERSNRERQEKVNEAMAQEFDREMEELYEKYQKKETKVDKVIQSIKTKSLDKSKIKPVHPDEPPSPTPNGYHVKYGQKYKHDKLDPHSAEFMPDTGNPVIDANIRKATDQEKKDRKVRILRKPSEMS